MSHLPSRSEYIDDMIDETSRDTQSLMRNTLETGKKRENERLWAFYRMCDVTQAEARDRAIRGPYSLSQSQASRIIRDKDGEMLTGEVESFAGPLAWHPEDYTHWPKSLKEEYRDVIAQALVQLEALNAFVDGETRTPEWAQAMFPDIDPNVGREVLLEQLGEPESMVHAPITDDDTDEGGTSVTAPADD